MSKNGMLGKLPLASLMGPADTLIQGLAGKNGPLWLQIIKQLQRLGPEKILSILDRDCLEGFQQKSTTLSSLDLSEILWKRIDLSQDLLVYLSDLDTASHNRINYGSCGFRRGKRLNRDSIIRGIRNKAVFKDVSEVLLLIFYLVHNAKEDVAWEVGRHNLFFVSNQSGSHISTIRLRFRKKTGRFVASFFEEPEHLWGNTEKGLTRIFFPHQDS